MLIENFNDIAGSSLDRSGRTSVPVEERRERSGFFGRASYLGMKTELDLFYEEFVN